MLSATDNRKPGLWLVEDHGIYLCSNDELAEGAKPLGAYAEECDPRRNDDWLVVKRRTFGGDDGVDFLDADGLEALIAASPSCAHLRISFLPDAMHRDRARLAIRRRAPSGGREPNHHNSRMSAPAGAFQPDDDVPRTQKKQPCRMTIPL
ncbi:DUF3085 domain-containing protein [Mycoplana azooxidifex]|uniref:DUF3085 domain-containing protein n=1 Tax=Mycoplana azooxidifex TaxID=1636188 RepID=UPI0031B63FFF